MVVVVRPRGAGTFLLAAAATTVDAICVLDFNWRAPAGLGDALEKVCQLASLAHAFSCALLIPPPRVLLDWNTHNNGHQLSTDAGWDRYLSHPHFVWESLPAGVRSAKRLRITDRMPTYMEMARLSAHAASSALHVIALDFSVNRFYEQVWPWPGGGRSILELIDELLVRKAAANTGDEVRRQQHQQHQHDVVRNRSIWRRTVVSPGNQSTLCEWPLAADVQQRSRRALQGCFGSQTEDYVVVRLRRNDRVTEYPSERCAREGVVEAVATTIAERSNDEVAVRAARRIFVATNEQDNAYLAGLHAALSKKADKVCLERDAPGIADVPDNFVAYLTGISIAKRARWTIHFHPVEGRNRRTLDRLAPFACNASEPSLPGWGVPKLAAERLRRQHQSR